MRLCSWLRERHEWEQCVTDKAPETHLGASALADTDNAVLAGMEHLAHLHDRTSHVTP
jgi:hypothetical protein